MTLRFRLVAAEATVPLLGGTSPAQVLSISGALGWRPLRRRGSAVA